MTEHQKNVLMLYQCYALNTPITEPVKALGMQSRYKVWIALTKAMPERVYAWLANTGM